MLDKASLLDLLKLGPTNRYGQLSPATVACWLDFDDGLSGLKPHRLLPNLEDQAGYGEAMPRWVFRFEGATEINRVRYACWLMAWQCAKPGQHNGRSSPVGWTDSVGGAYGFDVTVEGDRDKRGTDAGRKIIRERWSAVLERLPEYSETEEARSLMEAGRRLALLNREERARELREAADLWDAQAATVGAWPWPK